MTTHAIISAVAANRTRFFELIAALEKATGCNVSEEILTGTIDSQYDGRERLTKKEAQAVIFACAFKGKKGD